MLLEQLHEDFALERIALLRVDEHVVTVNATRGRIGAPTAAYAQHPRSVIRRVATTGRTHLAAGLDDADPWLAEVLLDAAPAGGYDPLPGAVLDADTRADLQRHDVVLLTVEPRVVVRAGRAPGRADRRPAVGRRGVLMAD